MPTQGMNGARGTSRSKHNTRRNGPRELFAALDLGTNSCRMLIAEPNGAEFRVVDAFSKSVRLGMDLERTGYLSRPAIRRTIAALKTCADKLNHFNVDHNKFIATEACRRAQNGQAFLDEVREETGLELEIIRASEEARLAVISCASLIEPDSKQVLIVDIGGGSTELVWIDVSDVAPENKAAAILKIRPSRRDPQHPRDADGARVVEEHIAEFLPYKSEDLTPLLDGFQVIGTSGTVTTVGAAHLGLQRYDRSKVDGLKMRSTEVDAVVSHFLALGPEGRRNHPGIGRDRTRGPRIVFAWQIGDCAKACSIR